MYRLSTSRELNLDTFREIETRILDWPLFPFFTKTTGIETNATSTNQAGSVLQEILQWKPRRDDAARLATTSKQVFFFANHSLYYCKSLLVSSGAP